jgi:hypothetical protein
MMQNCEKKNKTKDEKKKKNQAAGAASAPPLHLHFFRRSRSHLTVSNASLATTSAIRAFPALSCFGV